MGLLLLENIGEVIRVIKGMQGKKDYSVKVNHAAGEKQIGKKIG